MKNLILGCVGVFLLAAGLAFAACTGVDAAFVVSVLLLLFGSGCVVAALTNALSPDELP